MRISDWSSDVCSSDLPRPHACADRLVNVMGEARRQRSFHLRDGILCLRPDLFDGLTNDGFGQASTLGGLNEMTGVDLVDAVRSEERSVGEEWFRTCRSRWSPYK